jgi:hypothetical protein
MARYYWDSVTAGVVAGAAALRVMGGEPDPTSGATFYFDQTRANNPPQWASIYVHTTDIGAFHFYKPKGN